MERASRNEGAEVAYNGCNWSLSMNRRGNITRKLVG